MDKHDVARILEQIAALLELKGENTFKVRAYENAARAVDALEEDLGVLVAEKRVQEVRGIGSSIAAHVVELWTSGRLPYYETLCASVPAGYFDLLRIPGLGAKRIRTLCDLLEILSVADLKRAAEEGRVRTLKGFGEQSERKILEGIALLDRGTGRELAATVRPLAEEILAALRAHEAVERAEMGGSLRRWAETVKDVDLLAATRKPLEVGEAFLAMVAGASITAKGDTKVSVRLASGLAIDLRLVAPEQFPFALHYFTGSVAHNVRIRSRALDRGFSLNEYELSGAEHPPIRTEEELFGALGLPYIEPELREDRGEIEAAERNELPALVALKEIRGILHCHTTYSDGKSTLEEMAEAAVKTGASYLGIADHSQGARYAGGLFPEDLERQAAEIDEWNRKRPELRILKGSEVDILPDGTLDYPDSVLERLEFVVASIHSTFTMGEEEMTARIVKALRNKHVGILAHPTGRLLLMRDGYRVRFEEIYRVAAGEGVAIEINANPRRLDLDWREVKAAKAYGVRFAVNPDAHHVTGYLDIPHGVGVARKGWLAREDVINTLPVDQALAFLRARR